MTTKKIALLGILFVAVGAGIVTLLGRAPSQPVEVAEPSATTTPPVVDLTLIGQVTEVNFEQVPFDGPTLITFTTAGTNEVRRIVVPSLGLTGCAAAMEIADPFQLAPGDRVEVRGRLASDGTVEPCVDMGHYLRATRTEEKTAYGFQFTYEKGPRGYVLEEGTLEATDEALEVLYSGVFTNTEDYAAFVAATEPLEAPETFSVKVYENVAALRPAQWIEAYQAEANTERIVGTVEETVVAGANAVRYVTEGLYPNHTFVVAQGAFMYVFTGQYNDPLSAIGVDFGEFVAGIGFIATANGVIPLTVE